jgi:alkylation response protein AidB-like acyl-CoA dehydrogenase
VLDRTEEQQALWDTVVRIGRDVVAPGAADRDREGRFDHDGWSALADAGIIGLPIPEALGGSGGSILDLCVANEALGYAGRDAGLNLSLGAHWVIGTVPIWLHGTSEQQRRWLPGLCDGTVIGSWASTEPEAGSDAAALRTTAVRDGDEWVIDGTKIFITNAAIAGVCTVLAKTSDRGATAFIVDTSTPGFQVGRELDKLGCRSSPTSEVHLTSCRVPASSVLGTVDEGLWRVAFECFDWERTVMIAGSVGGMQATLEETVTYTKQREQFGRPIAHHQVVAHKLAQMKINLEVCRLAVWRAASLKQAGREHQVEASTAKALVGELAVANALEAVQLHGGYGYLKDFPVERALRDAKLVGIGGGTTEIQKLLISRALLA